MLAKLPPILDPNLLMGFDANDDAAVYRLDAQTAAVLTADFITPLLDDPYEFGRVAAANAVSDIYAMGARPLVALNLLALSPELGSTVVDGCGDGGASAVVDGYGNGESRTVAAEILRGGFDAIAQAGAVIAGGHTIEDDEPKYGLAVFGTVHPDKIVANRGALPGDLLFYTKNLGIGIMMSAMRIGLESRASAAATVEQMMELNANAAEAMLAAEAHAATDVTGFGMVGHLHEMLLASGVCAKLDCAALPLFDRVLGHSAAMCRPGKSFDLQRWSEPFLHRAPSNAESAGAAAEGTAHNSPANDDAYLGILCDPQTSGGLLVAVAPDKAALFVEKFEALAGRRPTQIGKVNHGEPGHIYL
jgi:selenide,water dikinase